MMRAIEDTNNRSSKNRTSNAWWKGHRFAFLQNIYLAKPRKSGVPLNNSGNFPKKGPAPKKAYQQSCSFSGLPLDKTQKEYPKTNKQIKKQKENTEQQGNDSMAVSGLSVPSARFS